jgi:PASTA domain
MSRRGIATVTAALAITAPMAAPGLAQAESVTIGSALQKPYQLGDFNALPAPRMAVQRSLANPQHPLNSPVNGRITSWAVRSGDSGALYSLRVLGLVGGFTYLANGTATAPAPIPANTDTIYTYPASLVIGEGETIGIQSSGSHGLPANLLSSTSADRAVGGPAIPDGSTGSLTAESPVELLVQARIDFCRVPKLKGKPVKKAKKQLRAAGCGVKVKKRRASGKKRGKVLAQKPRKNQTVPPGTAVRIFVGA